MYCFKLIFNEKFSKNCYIIKSKNLKNINLNKELECLK
ncbi:hypothetical protein BGAPBR_0590 [Borreliella garinii PBr]|uniref:Uncharacterized protein n=1 Tax=Borreliella garinii PBr TaxID=498743 RepID=B7XRW3_BORGR|nr:hypothetical protein BGAPBR_0590 [Borreliella garinii PBr]